MMYDINNQYSGTKLSESIFLQNLRAFIALGTFNILHFPINYMAVNTALNNIYQQYNPCLQLLEFPCKYNSIGNNGVDNLQLAIKSILQVHLLYF